MWKTVKLGDVCEISIGKTPSRGDKRFWDKEKVITFGYLLLT